MKPYSGAATHDVARPGIRPTTIEPMVANIDIAPTIIDLAGGKYPRIWMGKASCPLTHW